MDISTILLIIGSFILGAVFVLLLKKDKQGQIEGKSNSNLSKIEEEKQALAKKLSDAIEESDKKTTDIKSKYEKLLAEAKAQCEKLDSELNNAINSNIDSFIKEKLEDADKLKKRIRDLEEELEENEDDISDLNKKIKTKDSDLADLQDSLSKEQNTSKLLQEDLDRVKIQLDDKVQELKIKIGSLDFIQEILSANEFGTDDTKELYKNIDFFESFVKGQFTDVNSFLYSTDKLTWGDVEGVTGFKNKKQFFYDGFDQWASTKRKNWLDGKTTIAFVGEFSAGKTSIVNRILSQDNTAIPQLPVSTKATTAIPTYIAGGPVVSYSFISGDGKRKTILEDTFKKVSKDILDQVKGVSSLIKYFVMTYKNPNLNGLSILDTPGFNSNDKEDRERTIDVINECDALFWVFDVNAGTVNRSSISVIKEKLNKPLYIVINKVDTKSESDVKKVEELIQKTLSNEGLSVQQFIHFSSKAPLANIMNPIKSVNKIAARDTFVADVRTDLEQLLKILDDAVKSGNESYDSVRQQGEDITDQFIDCMKLLQSDCETAYNMPTWVEHTFRKDRFEMTASEGNHLKELLAQIADDRIQALAQKFDERVDKAAEIQQEWSDLCDLKAAWQKVNECLEQYNKIIKNIN